MAPPAALFPTRVIAPVALGPPMVPPAAQWFERQVTPAKSPPTLVPVTEIDALPRDSILLPAAILTPGA